MAQPTKSKKQGNAHARPSRPDSGDAFIRDPGSGPAHTNDALAESLAEDFLSSATSGEEQGEETADAIVPEEDGGPFVVTTRAQELGHGADASNPKGSMREPFPTANRVR